MSRESLQSTKRMDDLCANKEAGASPETSNIPKQEDKRFLTASQENQEQLDQASVSNKVDIGGFKPQLSCGLMVKRERLLKDLKLHGPQAGITVISAPEGMGKTALLLQYVGEVRQDPARGSACLVDASNMDSEDLYIKLKALSHELPPVMHPLIAVDNMPALGSEALKVFPELLRTLRDKGFEFVLSCRPKMHELSQVLGDSYKLGAQALAVRPREYSSWAQAFAIDRTLDVYGLTQGIPSLVVTLQSFDGRTITSEPLEKTAVELYESILSDLRAESEGMYRLACLLLLMGEGEVVALHRDNWRIRAETTA